MSGKLYNQDEITLCTYAAIYDAQDFGGIMNIQKLQGRSIDSIKMKIGNIAAMLDEKGISRQNNVNPLSGKPRGENGRRTNWRWVEPLTLINRSTLLKKCQSIINS